MKQHLPLLKRLRAKLVEAQFEGDDSVNGLCGVFSYAVYRLLRKMGLKPQLQGNNYHVFVRCGLWYVDLTGSQFNEKKRKIKLPSVYLKQHPYDQAKPTYATTGIHHTQHVYRSEADFLAAMQRWHIQLTPHKTTINQIVDELLQPKQPS